MLVNFRASPDGEAVAFEFYDTRFIAPKDAKAGRKHRGLGLLEWRTGRLTRIPNPPGRQLSAPSWAYDGKRLVAAMGGYGSLNPTQIITIDIPSFKVTEVVGGPDIPGDGRYTMRTSPVFQPETDNILYVEGEWARIPLHLHLFDLRNGADRVVLPQEEGFMSGLFKPSFIAPTEIIFQAEGPANDDCRKKIVELAGASVATVSYRLKFGDKIRLFLPELDKRHSSTDPHVLNLSASANGQVVIGVRQSLIQPKNAHGLHNLEIFRIDNGRLTELTDLRSWIPFASIAYDGSVIAFSSDPTRKGIIDLFILDLTTGLTTATGLLARIRQLPDFMLR